MEGRDSVVASQFDPESTGKLIYRNYASTDFGIGLSVPWVPVHAARDITFTHVPGKNGDNAQDDGSYQNVVETFTGIVFLDHNLYKNWFELNTAITDWLSGGDYSLLSFSGYPDYVFEAIAQSITITPDSNNSENRATISMPFNCYPIMIRTDGIEWQRAPNGDVTNTEDLTARPDWHIKGSGNFYITINDEQYNFNDVDGEVYLDGETGNAYYYDSDGKLVSKNPDCEFPGLDSPELLCGRNTVSYGAQENLKIDSDTGQTAASGTGQTTGGVTVNYPDPIVEYKPNWKRVI